MTLPIVINTLGVIEIRHLTSSEINGTLDLMRNVYFKHETTSNAIGLSGSSEAIKELDLLTIKVAKEGFSFAAIDSNTKKVVGCLLGVLNNKNRTGLWDEIAVKHTLAKNFLELNSALDRHCDPFGFLQTDCFFEILFVAIEPEYRKSKLATQMISLGVQLAQGLKDGEAKIAAFDENSGENNCLDRPTAVWALCTNKTSKYIVDFLGFSYAATVDVMKEKPFEGVFNLECPPIECMYKPLP